MTKEEKQYMLMTETKIPKLITFLAIPTVISMLITALYNFGDTYFITLLKNDSITSAVSVVFPLMAIIQAIGFMIGMGAGSIIARLLGKHLVDEANKVASSALFGAILIGTIIMIFGLIFIDPLMIVIRASSTVKTYAKDYAFFIILAAPIMMASYVLNNALRAEGKAKLSTVGMVIGVCLNLLLDPLFIFTFNLGVKGASIATAISMFIGFLIMLSFYLSNKTVVKLGFKSISFKMSDYGIIFIIGLPSLLRQGLASIATIILNDQAYTYVGDPGTAAMGVVTKITQIVFMIMLGIGQGYQPVVGYNYSAKKYQRVKDAFWFMVIMSSIIMLVGSGILAIFSRPLVNVLVHDESGVSIGVNTLLFQCIGLVLCPLGVACNMSYQSLGKKVRAILVSCLRQGICYIPFIIVLPIFIGVTGVELSLMIADILTFFICIPFALSFFKDINNHMKEDINNLEEFTQI